MTFGTGPAGFGAPTDPEILAQQAEAKRERYTKQGVADELAREYRKDHPGWLRRLFRRH